MTTTVAETKARPATNERRISADMRATEGTAEDRKAVARSLPAVQEPSPQKRVNGAPDGAETHSLQDLVDYQRDFLERTILFWDTLRQRANNMLEHERAGLPPLLDFKYETLLDARRFEHPANYALLRITEIGEDYWDDCVDPEKPPVIVVDPRAGHGPGIGGFKRDSEVGMAMREGHPVYFVIFFPEPAPGQTLADVLHALRRFVEDVARRHPGKRPVLYGNCQAGWAVTLLSADCEGLVGPAVLLAKTLEYLTGAIAAGITMGLAVPVVLTSRADPAPARLASLALAALVHHRIPQVQIKAVAPESSLHCTPQPDHECRPLPG